MSNRGFLSCSVGVVAFGDEEAESRLDVHFIECRLKGHLRWNTNARKSFSHCLLPMSVYVTYILKFCLNFIYYVCILYVFVQLQCYNVVGILLLL